ncbi:MAG: phosphodiesterase [Woeseiaceae bacterium]|nr:phosphodiesterase [Woeseiaceae bacterium]
MRVLHLTDPHLFADKDGELRGINTYSSLTDVLKHVASSDWRADHVACTGDLIQDDSPGAYEHFKNLLATLNLPVHCVPGNHDIRQLMQAALVDAPFYYCDAADLGDWLMVGIDSCLGGSAGGKISDDELDRMDNEINASSASHVVVCLHHPPAAMHSKWLDTVGLENGDVFLERLNAQDRVRLALFGHVHQVYDQQHGRVRVLGTPSTCRQFKPQSDEFTLDERSPAYRRLTLHADGTFDNELIWIDDA